MQDTQVSGRLVRHLRPHTSPPRLLVGAVTTLTPLIPHVTGVFNLFNYFYSTYYGQKDHGPAASSFATKRALSIKTQLGHND